jgi:MoaA/NifB/PqqE/SkfB family radical SAM enzyme
MKLSYFMNKADSAVKYFMNSQRAGIPLELFLILTDECNYRCQVCSLWRGIHKETNKIHMSLDEIKALIGEGAALGVPTLIISGGEPLLHPHFLEIAEYAVSRMENVRVNTNASLITEETAKALVGMGLHEIWASLDGIGEYSDNFRGVKDAYARTTAGIRMLSEQKKKAKSAKPRILIDTIVTEENVSSLPECMGVFRGLGADEVNLVHTCYVSPETIKETEKMLGRENIYSGQFSTPMGEKTVGARISKEQYREIRRAARGLGMYVDPLLLAPPGAVRSQCRCLFPWMNMTIYPGGDACACPLMDFITIGNVREKSIMEIWNGEPIKEMRRKSGKGFPVCKYCICTRRVPLDHLKHRQSLSRVFG